MRGNVFVSLGQTFELCVEFARVEKTLNIKELGDSCYGIFQLKMLATSLITLYEILQICYSAALSVGYLI